MEYKDQMGRQLQFSKVPVRIVSLVPSQTELLVDLGLEEYIVGVTKFCVHPENLRKKKVVVGGTKQIHLQKIQSLDPDIILCNKEENTETIVNELSEIAPVHVSDIKIIDDVLELIEMYGALFQISQNAESISKEIQQRYRLFSKSIVAFENNKVAYFIWRDPWMVAGQDTFIDYLLSVCGFINMCTEEEGRYPELQLKKLEDVDYVFLSSEPFPFVKKHCAELQPFTKGQIVLVDGEYFSWYGSRLLSAFEYFADLRKQLKL